MELFYRYQKVKQAVVQILRGGGEGIPLGQIC